MYKTDGVYCFLDTNILIHFRMFDEVDWCDVLEATQVHLMLAPAVIAELNQHKDNRNNEWRQKRARKVLSKLKDFLKDIAPGNPAQIRAGVLLLEITREPCVDWIALGLDPQVKDDRLLATIIEYSKQQPLHRLLLISDDFLIQRRAPIHNIQVIEPRDKIKEIEQPSITTARIQELERQLREYKSQLPDLSFGFWENETITNLVARVITRKPENGPSDDEISQQIVEQENRLDLIIAEAKYMKIAEREIQKFSNEYNRYITWLSRALFEQRSREFGPSCRVGFVLLNNGSVPAKDVDIWLHFPTGSFVVGADSKSLELFDEVMVPNVPRPEWERSNDMFLSSIISSRTAAPPESPRPKGPLYDFKYRGGVSYNHPKFRQKDQWYMNAVIAYLPPKTKGGFQIEYSVEADNLPEPIKGQLNVALQESD